MSLSRPLLIGLIVSAALNVFLIGGVAGVTYVRLTSPPPAERAGTRPAAAPAYVAPSPAPVLPAAEAPDAPAPARAPAPAAAAPPAGERLARPPLWTAGDQLSPESRRALRQALRAANQKNQAISRRARAERLAALEALNAANFDPAEANRRLNAARALDIEARANVEAALTAYAATLSPQERAVLVKGLSRIYAPRRALARADEE